MKQTDPQFKFRMPQELKDSIVQRAEAYGAKTLSAQIVELIVRGLRVHQAGPGETNLAGVPTSELLAEIARRCD